MEMVSRNIKNQRISNIRKPYTITEKFRIANEKKIKYLNTEINNNKIYWDAFSNNSGKSKGSLFQYKSTIFNFMELVNKDICLVTKEDIDLFVNNIDNENTKANKIAHIKSILIYIVKENVEECLDRISKDTLILIISL